MFLIQHGWGKGAKITGAIADGDCDGVIMGPCDEAPPSLAALATEVANAGLEVLLDPQFYVFTLPQPNLKRLPDYPYSHPGLRPTDFSARRVSSLVSECLNYQVGLPVTALVGPSVIQNSLSDQWAQVATTLTAESIAWREDTEDDRPLFCSLILGEETLSDRENLDEFLDTLTELDCDGFYLIVSRSSGTYDLVLETTRLTNLLLSIHSLTEINEFRVIVGYADLLGLLYRAVGAETFGSGWYNTIRRFHTDRWLGTGGGRAPRPRYTSESLLNNILVETEMRSIAERGRLDEIIGSSARDNAFRAGAPRVDQVPWNQEDQHRHYLYVCKQLDDALSGTLVGRLQTLIRRIDEARTLYSDLTQNESVVFTPETGPRHLGVWMAALDAFAAEVGISL